MRVLVADVPALLRLATGGSDPGISRFAERKRAEIRETIDRLEALSAALEQVVGQRPGSSGLEAPALEENPLPAAVEEAFAQRTASGMSVAGGARATAAVHRLAA